MYLFFDTETSGLPFNHLPEDHPDQPDIVQLAAIAMDLEFNELASCNFIIDCGEKEIPLGASNIHGITTEISRRYGVPLATAMSAYYQFRAKAGMIVAHNIDFDLKLIRYASHKLGRKPTHPGPSVHACTMEMSSPILQLPPTAKMVRAGFNKFKAPKLEECIQFFFGEKLEGAHDALVDVRGCARVFRHIRELPPVQGEQGA